MDFCLRLCMENESGNIHFANIYSWDDMGFMADKSSDEMKQKKIKKTFHLVAITFAFKKYEYIFQYNYTWKNAKINL